MKLTNHLLVKEAKLFCEISNNKKHPKLEGISDEKAIGTYIEQEFKLFLSEKYEFDMGSSAYGIDFPDVSINTDIKVTSRKKPQNSCPFKDIRQKIYGLGYNILLFIYNMDKENDLKFESCNFIKSNQTGDYNLTKNLIQMVENNWKKEDITKYLIECKIPGNLDTLEQLSEEIINNPPEQGYLTISNALQWRLKYSHIKDTTETITENNTKKEYGDYQTPLYFTKKIVDYTKKEYNLNPDLIIEPTCGIGNFIKASRQQYPNVPIIGIDINEEYLKQIDFDINGIKLFNENIFTFDFNKIKKDTDTNYLIIGNPPWITNTQLSKFNSDNIPMKRNYKKLEFFHAITGESNFDVSEFIILRIIEEFKKLNTSLVFLCKYTVACNIFEQIVKNNIKLARIEIIKFDSMKIFKADTSSCIFIIQFNHENKDITTCDVTNIDNIDEKYTIGVINDKLYSDVNNIVDVDGECPFEWRQGIKHDCAKIMELEQDGTNYKNKKDEQVILEENLLYPLLKTSNLKNPIINSSDKKIIITQHKLKEDTSYIKEDCPLTWKYLYKNREYFENRKSSIYINTPPYSIFGIGEYTFKKYKVAISGFYKKGLFTLVYADDKSMMLDDTCYYISFDNYNHAYITMLILNSYVVKKFLSSIVFLDSKRPYTKKVLKRVDLIKAVNILSIDDLVKTENNLNLDNYITQEKYENYLKFLKSIDKKS